MHSNDRRLNLRYFLLFTIYPFVLGLLGLVIYGSPLGPDAIQSWWPQVGAFCIFLFWLSGLWRAGATFCRIFVKEHLGATYFLPAGALVYIAIAMTLMHLGILSYARYYVLLIPHVIFLCTGAGHSWSAVSQIIKRKQSYWRLALGSILFAPLFFATWRLDAFPDPLWYHLSAPRLWLDAGKVFAPEHAAVLFLTSYWEYLYLWGFAFLGSVNGGGLIAGQLFGQWISLFVAGFGSFLLLRSTYQNLFSKNPECLWRKEIFCAAALLAGAQLSGLYLAKNDWGAILFLLASTSLALSARPRHVWLAGLFIGVGLATKLTNGFFCLGLIGFIFIQNKHTKNSLWLFLASLLIGLLPFLLRNYLYTKNPFFPSLQFIFHSPYLGPTWNSLAKYEGGTDFVGKFDQLKDKIIYLLIETRLTIAIAALGMFFSGINEAKKLWLALVAAFLLFTLRTGSLVETRLFGAGLVLLCGVSAVLAFDLLEKKLKPWLAGCLLLTIFIIGAPIPWNSPSDVWHAQNPAEEIRQHEGGAALAWLRLNMNANETAASANDTRLYYASSLQMIRLWDDAKLDQMLASKNSLQDIANVLNAEKIRYILLTDTLVDTFNNRLVWDQLVQGTNTSPQCLVFSTAHSRVLDLDCLRRKIL